MLFIMKYYCFENWCSVIGRMLVSVFLTPEETKEGKFVDKKFPFTGVVRIPGKFIKGRDFPTKTKRTIVIWKYYLHFIDKYRRFEERHKNVQVRSSASRSRQFRLIL